MLFQRNFSGLAGAVFSAVLCFGVSEARANLLLNPSFENDGGPGSGSTSLSCPILDWSTSLACGPSLSAGEANSYDPALDGHYSYLFIGTPGQLGYVSQTVTTVVGEAYTLSFSFTNDGQSGNELQALWGGNIILDQTGGAVDPNWATFGTYSFVEIATSTSTTITFAGLGDGAHGVGFDDTDLEDTPEPMSLAIFGAGLAGLGLLRRRQSARLV